MKWIGINKQDKEPKKFEFDDEIILTTDPPQYSIRFIDTNETTSIPCSNVFKLKPASPIKRKKHNFESKQQDMHTDIPPMEKPALDDFDDDMKDDILDELKPKWGESKLVMPEIQQVSPNVKKSKNNVIDISEIPPTTLDKEVIDYYRDNKPNHKYEYKTILDDFDDTGLLDEKLNKLGEEMWEIINFNIIQSLFPNKSRLFCILKRMKQ